MVSADMKKVPVSGVQLLSGREHSAFFYYANKNGELSSRDPAACWLPRATINVLAELFGHVGL